jgi:hemolysin III
VASAAYNLAPNGTLKDILRRFDHSAIFVMIAATYTPFAAARRGYPVGDVILALVWSAAAVGIALKMLFPRRFEKVSIALYLAMGWLIVTAIKPLAASVAAIDFWLLIAGGLIYSAGVAFYLIERIPFHKAIWHGFVLAAAVLHFAAIAMEFT